MTFLDGVSVKEGWDCSSRSWHAASTRMAGDRAPRLTPKGVCIAVHPLSLPSLPLPLTPCVFYCFFPQLSDCLCKVEERPLSISLPLSRSFFKLSFPTSTPVWSRLWSVWIKWTRDFVIHGIFNRSLVPTNVSLSQVIAGILFALCLWFPFLRVKGILIFTAAGAHYITHWLRMLGRWEWCAEITCSA